MRIQHNIAALNSYRQLGTNNSAISKNLEKLSSGYKINRAGDDAAGLAISEKMRAQITGLETAQKNANDGISLVQTAEGALTEVHSMLNRMVELATQSSNGTYDNEVDRANLQAEIESLTSEIDRIADSTNFNGINLLDGSLSENPATFEIDLKSIDFEGTVKAGDTFKLEIGGGAAAKAAGGSTESIVLESREAYGDETSAKDIAKLFDGQSVTINGEKYTAKVGDNGILKFTSKTRGELTQLPTEGSIVKISSTNKNITFKNDSTTILSVVNGGPGTVAGTDNGSDDTEPTPTKTTLTFNLAGLSLNSNLAAGETLKLDFGNGKEINVTGKTTTGTAATDIAGAFEGEEITIDGVKYTVSVEDSKLTLEAETAGAPETTTELDKITTVSVSVSGGSASNTTSGSITDNKVTVTKGTDGTEEVVATASIQSRAGADEGTATTISFDLTGATIKSNLAADETLKLELMSGVELSVTGKTTTGTAATDIAGAFHGAKVTIDGVEYTAEADGAEITLTAGKVGVPKDTTQLDQIKTGSISLSVSGGGVSNTATAQANTKTVTVVEGTDPVGDGENQAVDAKFEIDLSAFTVTGNATDDTVLEIDFGNGVKLTSDKITAADGGHTATAEEIATAFKDKSVEIDGVTYNVTVDGKKLVLTATGEGAVEGVPTDGKKFNISKTTGSGTLAGGTEVTVSGSDVGKDAPVDNGDNTEGTTTNKSLTLQIGDTADSFNKITVSIGSMSAETLNIADIDISTPKGAEQAIQNIKQAINTVSSQRGELGAIQNRLEHTINNLGVTTENITSAESRIRDTDMAEEMMAYTKNNILVQASQAMLAQANTLPQGVLQLLQ